MMEPVSYVGESNYHRLGNKLKGETTAARMRRVRQRNPAHVPTLDAKPSQLGGVVDYLNLSGNLLVDIVGGAAYGASIGAVAGLATSHKAFDPISSIEEVNDLTRAVMGKGKYAGKSRGTRLIQATQDTFTGAASLAIYGGIPAITTTGLIDWRPRLPGLFKKKDVTATSYDSMTDGDFYRQTGTDSRNLGAIISKDERILMVSGLAGGVIAIGGLGAYSIAKEQEWLPAVGTAIGYLSVAGLSAALIPEVAAFWRGFGGVVGGGFGYAMAQEATTAREILGRD